MKNSRLPEELKAESLSNMMRVAPGVDAWFPRDGKPDEFCFARWTPAADGNGWRPVPVGGRLARITPELCAEIGLGKVDTEGQRRTLFRLARAGFVDIVHVSPGVWLLDVQSWFAHLRACMDNPGMWDPGSDDLETYLEANGLRKI